MRGDRPLAGRNGAAQAGSMSDPYRPFDDDARALLPQMLGVSHGALGTVADGVPLVTRVATLWLPDVGMTLLLSDLSDHAKALALKPACSLLVGEPGAKGDPLTHPRLSIVGTALAVDKDRVRDQWLADRPKTQLYFDFTDFRVVRIEADLALLNAGFGKAYRLSPGDLGPMAQS